MTRVCDINIMFERRPCYIKDRKAMFHIWSHEKEVIGPSLMVGGHNGGEFARTMGIVEYEDGTVEKVLPEHIRFADDGGFHDTCFLSRK